LQSWNSFLRKRNEKAGSGDAGATYRPPREARNFRAETAERRRDYSG
jgi:hypothetical protein